MPHVLLGEIFDRFHRHSEHSRPARRMQRALLGNVPWVQRSQHLHEVVEPLVHLLSPALFSAFLALQSLHFLRIFTLLHCRSDELRVGNVCVTTCTFWRSPNPYKQTRN